MDLSGERSLPQDDSVRGAEKDSNKAARGASALNLLF